MTRRLLVRLHTWQADLVERRAGLDPESGASTVEVLSWAAMSTVAVVAIGAALQVLGVDIINSIRGQLGL